METTTKGRGCMEPNRAQQGHTWTGGSTLTRLRCTRSVPHKQPPAAAHDSTEIPCRKNVGLMGLPAPCGRYGWRWLGTAQECRRGLGPYHALDQHNARCPAPYKSPFK